jgi:O-antigen/teichoic acid export membrane protein
MHQIVMAGYGFLLLFILLRILPAAEVGNWLIFISAISLCDMLMHGLLQTIVVKKITEINDAPNRIKEIQSNAMLLSFLLVAFIAFIFISFRTLSSFFESDYLLMNNLTKWYPFLGICMALYNISWWTNSAKSLFKIVFIQRIIYCIVSFLIIGINYFLFNSIVFEVLVVSQLVAFAISALYGCFVNKITFQFKYLQKNILIEMLQYGKYTIGTMFGSSLLRNADVFMIAFFMNTTAVSIYTLAQKIIEIFEVVLRSIAVTTMPLLISLRENTSLFTRKLLVRIGFVSFLFFPIITMVLFFSETIIAFFNTSIIYIESATILRAFMVYVLLLPLDRLMGVALEAANKPQLNLLKTCCIIAINLIGNFIALYYLNSLVWVAFVSSIALISGISFGIYCLIKYRIIDVSIYKTKIQVAKLKLQ